MRQSLIVCEEVRESLHRDSKPLGQNIVPCCGNVLRALDLELVGLVADSPTEVGLSFDPHGGIGDLLDVIEFVVPDRRVRSRVVSLENIKELLLHVVTARVTNGTLRRDGEDEVVIYF